MPARALGDRARTALVASVVGTFALYVIPSGWYLAYPLVLVSTVVHELGHGITAIATGGSFLELRIWSDGSGMAWHTSAGGAVADAFVGAGGLCGPAVAAAGFLALGRRPARARWCLGAFAAFLVVALALWVRGAFGMCFVGVLAAGCGFAAIYPTAETAQVVLVFLATQLALSVYSRGDYLFATRATTGGGTSPSDVQQMADALGGPYWLWGVACAVFSAGVLVAAAWAYLRPRAAAANRPPAPRYSRRPR